MKASIAAFLIKKYVAKSQKPTTIPRQIAYRIKAWTFFTYAFQQTAFIYFIVLYIRR